MYIAIDFDGTLVDHRYPDIGAEVPAAFEWCRQLAAAGAKLILWTMRSDSVKAGPVLTDAVAFCRERGVEFAGVNVNPGQDWSTSPKAYAHVYVDDAAFGCPLRDNPRAGGRPYADWERIGPAVMALVEQDARK